MAYAIMPPECWSQACGKLPSLLVTISSDLYNWLLWCFATTGSICYCLQLVFGHVYA